MGLSTLLALCLSAPVSAGDVGTTVKAFGEPLAGSPQPDAAGSRQLEESDWIAEPFDAVLLQGEGAEPASQFQVARADAAGNWSPWIDARPKRFPGRRFWAKAVFPDARPGRLRVRVNGPASMVRFFAIETFRSAEREDPSIARPRNMTPPPPELTAPEPELYDRAAWGAKPPREEYSIHVPEKFTQHHTAGKYTSTLQESLAEIRFIQDFHQTGRGWSDVGYHYLVDGAGRIFRGRPIDARGAHVRGFNEGNIGISLLGNYHPPYDDAMTPAQREAVRRLGAWLRDRYGIQPSVLRGHRDYNPRTDCPGDLTYALLPELRRAIEATPGPIMAALRRLRLERLPGIFSEPAR
ncbi:MAG: N-acetylmuramoyl-L-alanine amidase [Elusimicrobia bacterium]|nr:N-acetylmuramoyl-L-alanine amidase [Elusimicrobiota bacterium]